MKIVNYKGKKFLNLISISKFYRKTYHKLNLPHDTT